MNYRHAFHAGNAADCMKHAVLVWLVRALLRKPLAADDAVRVALLSNRALQAAYSELALAEADQVQESLPPNPTLSLSRIAGGGAVEIERQVVVDILALATLPARSEFARQRFAAAQWRAVEATLRLAADVRRAHARAVAASELVALLAETKDTTAPGYAITCACAPAASGSRPPRSARRAPTRSESPRRPRPPCGTAAPPSRCRAPPAPAPSAGAGVPR